MIIASAEPSTPGVRGGCWRWGEGEGEGKGRGAEGGLVRGPKPESATRPPGGPGSGPARGLLVKNQLNVYISLSDNQRRYTACNDPLNLFIFIFIFIYCLFEIVMFGC